jgi:sulfide:quinone oxidoreductase
LTWISVAAPGCRDDALRILRSIAMTRIVVLGAGLAGMSAAFELRAELGPDAGITVLGDGPRFGFTPSNPWLAVGWREPGDITLDAGRCLANRGIDFLPHPARAIDAAGNRVLAGDGEEIAYDYLVVCTGPRLAFEEVPGMGPDAGHTESICTTAHATRAWAAYSRFLEHPGPVLVGAVQGASCFGPAYEFALILDADLRRRKLRDKVPMQLVTSEPYVGHLGLMGVGDSRGMLEAELRKRDIQWTANASIAGFGPGMARVVPHDEDGTAKRELELPFSFAMFLPAFRGSGLAVSLLFGLLVSTVLTLVVIPLLYYGWLRREAARG